jgi:lambda family phage minor tail protein L
MTTPTIKSQLQVLHSADGLVDLYILDCSSFGGSVYHFANTTYSDGSFLSWGGQTYVLLPIGIDNTEFKADGSELPQATVTVSGVGGELLAPIVALGDLVGATLSHYQTKVSYLDGQANPDTTQYIGPRVWRVVQKSQEQSGVSISWTLASPIDIPGQKFPIRQILIYPGINPPDGIYFPGVSPMRNNQYQSQ